MVEFAITLPLFLLIVIGLSELALIHYNKVLLQHSVVASGRWAILGQTTPPDDRITSIKLRVVKESEQAGVPVKVNEVSVCPLTNLSCPGNNPGLPGDFIRIEAKKKMHLLGLYPMTLTVSAVVKNEYFG